jgi:hypothetical protein
VSLLENSFSIVPPKEIKKTMENLEKRISRDREENIT